MERKKPVLGESYCCNEVEDIMRTLVEKYDVGQMEVTAFEDVFNQHNLTNLDRRNAYRDEKTWALNIDALVSRLFEIASLFKGDVRAFFFDSYFKEGERHNSRRIGETDFHLAKMKIKERLAADDGNKNIYHKSGGTPQHKVLALYYIYLQAKGYLPRFASGSKTKTDEIAEIAVKYGISAKKFELTFNELHKRENRLDNVRIEHIEDVLQMLTDYPEALKMADDELRILQGRIS